MLQICSRRKLFRLFRTCIYTDSSPTASLTVTIRFVLIFFIGVILLFIYIHTNKLYKQMYLPYLCEKTYWQKKTKIIPCGSCNITVADWIDPGTGKQPRKLVFRILIFHLFSSLNCCIFKYAVIGVLTIRSKKEAKVRWKILLFILTLALIFIFLGK